MHFNRVQVKRALAYFDKESMFPEQYEIDTIEDVVKALGLVEAASRDLCGRKETLASADRV